MIPTLPASDMIQELIERVEKCAEIDRELEADIIVALKGGEIIWKQAAYTMEMYPVRRYASSIHVGGFGSEAVPLLCSSLNAILALVEDVMPGWRWSRGFDGRVYLQEPGHDGARNYLPPVVSQRPLASDALTMVAALLRALQAKEGGAR